MNKMMIKMITMMTKIIFHQENISTAQPISQQWQLREGPGGQEGYVDGRYNVEYTDRPKTERLMKSFENLFLTPGAATFVIFGTVGPHPLCFGTDFGPLHIAGKKWEPKNLVSHNFGRFM